MATLVLAAASAGTGSGFAMAGLGLALNAAMGGMMNPGSLRDADAYQVGPRLEDLKAQSSAHGAMIPLVFGIARVAGNVIWSTPITQSSEEILIGETSVNGGKAGSGRTPAYQTRYFYTATFAVILAYSFYKQQLDPSYQLDSCMITITARSDRISTDWAYWFRLFLGYK